MMKSCLRHLKQRWYFVILSGIVIVAAAVRLWGLGNVPFVADEFLDVNATYGFFKTGEWQAWDFNHEMPSVRINEASDERAWVYRWQVSQLYRFLPPTEDTVRLISTLWGIITTLILYFVTYRFTKNRWIALVAAFLWAVSVPAIEINRKIRMYSMFAPIFLLFMWGLFEFIESAVSSKIRHTGIGKANLSLLIRAFFAVRWIYAFPVVVFGALAAHLHPLTGNFAVVVIMYFMLMIYVGESGVMRQRYGAYLGTIVLVLFAVKIFRPTEWTYFIHTLTVTDHVNYIHHIMRNYWHPLLGAVFILLGAWALVRDTAQKRSGIWIVASFFTILIMAIFFWARNVGPQYIFFIQPFGLMLAAAGVVHLAQYLEKMTQKRTFFYGIMCAGCIFLPYYGYFFTENNTYRITAESDTVNYRKVFDYVKRNYTEGDVLVTRNFRNYYWSGLDARVFDFGSERSEEILTQEGKVTKITLAYMQDIVQKHPAGWVIIADNDEVFIEKEAQEYFDVHLTRVKGSSLLNGDVRVYRWGLRD